MHSNVEKEKKKKQSQINKMHESRHTLKCGLQTCNSVAEVFILTHVTGDSFEIPCERGETWPKELTVGGAGGGVYTYTSGSFCCS